MPQEDHRTAVKNKPRMLGNALALAVGCLFGLQAWALPVRVSVTNLAPAGGAYLTPLWFGFQDGNFDTYNKGQNVAATFVESLAEDGVINPATGINNPTIMPAFNASGHGFAQGAITGPGSTLPDGSARPPGPLAPGQTAKSAAINLNSAIVNYFSYGAMVIPSNDFFIANDDPKAHPIFDALGNFQPLNFFVLGSDVLDAGTEPDTESMDTAAFFPGPNLGKGGNENGTVHSAQGYIPDGPILTYAPNGTPVFGNADFTAPGYRVAEIRVTVVPEPATLLLFALGMGFMLILFRCELKHTPGRRAWG